MIIDSQRMLSFFDSADRIRHYNVCVDISLAGEDYTVNEIVFFAKNDNDPLSDYIQVKKFDDGFLLIGIYTQDAPLILECMEYIDTIKSEFTDIELRTPFDSVLKEKSVTARFTFEEPQYPSNPVYYIRYYDSLPNLIHDNITVTLLNDEDKTEITHALNMGILDPESWGDFRPCTSFKDVKWYIMRVKGEIAGYLRAECGYKNIYDIGWLYIEQKYRCKGYATELVLHFSKDMFEQDAIPHYGYAISKESSRVAEKCGYQCDTTQWLRRTLKNR